MHGELACRRCYVGCLAIHGRWTPIGLTAVGSICSLAPMCVLKGCNSPKTIMHGEMLHVEAELWPVSQLSVIRLLRTGWGGRRAAARQLLVEAGWKLEAGGQLGLYGGQDWKISELRILSAGCWWGSDGWMSAGWSWLASCEANTWATNKGGAREAGRDAADVGEALARDGKTWANACSEGFYKANL